MNDGLNGTNDTVTLVPDIVAVNSPMSNESARSEYWFM